MIIKDHIIQEIEKLPPHILIKILDIIKVYAAAEIIKNSNPQSDRGKLAKLGERSRKLLSGIKGSLSEDIIRVERQDRI